GRRGHEQAPRRRVRRRLLREPRPLRGATSHQIRGRAGLTTRRPDRPRDRGRPPRPRPTRPRPQHREARPMSSPNAPIESSIEIDAPPARVWEIVSEVRNAPQWSSQAVKVLALGGRTTAGTRSLNINKQGKLIWPTTAKVVEFEPGRRIANRVIENTSIWAFELEPTDAGGTRLVERRETPHGTSALSQFLVDKVFKDQPTFTEELGHGVSTSLTRIKALAEQG